MVKKSSKSIFTLTLKWYAEQRRLFRSFWRRQKALYRPLKKRFYRRAEVIFTWLTEPPPPPILHRRVSPKVDQISREIFGIKTYRSRALRLVGFGWRLSAVALLFVWIVAGVGPLELLNRSFAGIVGEDKTKTITLYASECATENVASSTESGWQNPEGAAGAPDVTARHKYNIFSRINAAYYLGGQGNLVCGHYQPVASTSLEKLAEEESATSTIEKEMADQMVTTTPDVIIVTSTSETATSTESVESESSASTTPEIASTTEVVVTTTDPIVTQINSSTDTGVNTITPPPVTEITEENQSVLPTEPISILGAVYEGVNTIISDVKNFVTDIFNTNATPASAEAAPPKKLADLGSFTSAKIHLSLAEMTQPIKPALESSSVNQPEATSTLVTTTTEQVATETTSSTESSTISPEVNATSSDEIITTTSPIESPDITRTTEIFNATSTTSETAAGLNEIVFWYAATNLATTSPGTLIWHELASLPLDGKISCAAFESKNACVRRLLLDRTAGGQFVFDAPNLKNWQDIENLQIKIEGRVDGQSEFELYVDSAWVTVQYQPDQKDEEPDDGYEPSDKMMLDGREIEFVYTDDNQDENIIIKTDSKQYYGVTNADVYFSVTNISDQTEAFGLQVHFPEDVGQVQKLERLKKGAWTEAVLTSEPLPEPGLLQKAFNKPLKRKAVPSSMRVKNSTKNNQTKIGPGKTQYFKMNINYRPQTAGEFFIEALGDNQGYGMLDPWWDGYWRYKLPITINNSANPNALTDYQVLLEIATSSPFWSRVKSDGGDIRVLNSTETTQLDTWIQYFTKTGSSSAIWVQVDSIPAATSTQIWLYYGNPAASTSSNMYSVFNYSSMKDLYYVTRGGLTSTSTVAIVSLMDNNQVQVGSSAPVTLNRQQVATFTPIYATTTVRAQGPINAKIFGVNNADNIAPISFSGTQFAVPSNTSTLESFYQYAPFASSTSQLYNGIALAVTRSIPTSTASTSAFNITTNAILESTNPVLLSFADALPGNSFVSYPATNRDLYGIRSNNNYVGIAATSSFTIYCSITANLAVAAQNRGALYTNARCGNGANGTGQAVRLANISGKIGAIQQNDGDGLESTVYLPDIEMSSEYMLPTAGSYIAVTCAPRGGTVALSVYSPTSTLMATSTCASTATNPGKAIFGTTTAMNFFPAGTRIVSTDSFPKPFYAYYEDNTATGGAGGDETNLWGAAQARQGTLFEPTISYGGETSYVITVSGKVYQDEGVTPLLTQPIINLGVNNAFIASTTASSTDGSYAFSNIFAPNPGSTTVAFIASTSVSGVSYNRYYGIDNIVNYDIYQNRVILRHDNAGPITNADIDRYDKDQNVLIKARVVTNNLTVSSTEELFVWPSDTYTPGGTITISAGVSASTSPGGDLYIAPDATLNAAAYAISLPGDWINKGTYNKSGAQTITFTASSTGFVVNNGTSTFQNLIFNGTNGGWIIASSTLDGNLTMTAGTLSGTSSVTVKGGTVTGNGIINFSGGNFTMLNSGNFFSATPWIFYNMTFGDGVTVASTTRTSSGSVTANGVVTVMNNHTLNAGTNIWNLAGGGTPLVLTGGVLPQTATFRYTATSSINVTPTTYYNLELSPSAAGTPTYTLLGGNFVTLNYFYIGDGVNPVVASANTNNPIIDVGGNFTIRANGSFVAPPSNNFLVFGSWLNSGTYNGNGGMVTFDSTTTAKTINAGASPFANVLLNGLGGGWTVSANATSTGNWTVATGTSFAVSSGMILAVGGSYFTNLGGASTTWTGATLSLFGPGTQTINSKTRGSDGYNILRIATGTYVRMWDSSSTTYTLGNAASLYSMDHSTATGSLYIFGGYQIPTSSIDYWNFGTNFDGSDLTASPRAVSVKIASGSSITVNGGSLNIIGSSTATTTIANQGVGNYNFGVNYGAFNAKYYKIGSTSLAGLNFTGSTTIASLDNGEYQLSITGGRMISLTPAVMAANPNFITRYNVFATTTGVTSGFNVYLGSAATEQWVFTQHSGNRAGENFDSDPGDPGGYILWDDSPLFTATSQNWQWYNDEINETPTSSAAAVNVAPSGIPSDSKLKLRLNIKNTSAISGNAVKMRLQYSTASDFSSNVNFAGEIGSSTALWTYADGVDIDNSAVSTRILASSTVAATHNESGISSSTYDLAAGAIGEWEFTIFNNRAASGTTYYFRAYTDQASVKTVLADVSSTYPSLVVGNSSLASVLSGVTAGTIIDGVMTTINTTYNSVPFGNISYGAPVSAGHRLQITTNADSGYQLFVFSTADLAEPRGSTISPIVSTNDNPQPWTIAPNQAGFGYHTSDDSLSGINPSRFAANDTYAKFETTIQEVGYNPTPSISDTIDLIYRLEATEQQPDGQYATSIEYIIVPTY